MQISSFLWALLGAVISIGAFYWSIRIVCAGLHHELSTAHHELTTLRRDLSEIKRRYARNRTELWEMWRAHAEAARVYIYVATVSAGSPGLESGADELESKEKYHEVIKQKHQLNYPNNIAHNNHVNLQQLWQCSWATEQVLEKRDYDKVGVLIVREQLGFEVRVKQSVSDPFLRYQIIDGERILLNIPEDSTALQSPLTYTPSERCVSIDDIHFTQQYVAEFRRQWKDAVTLAKFIERRIVLPLCSEPVVSEHVIHDIVKLTGLPVEVIRGAAKTLAKEGAFRLDSADHAS